MYWENMTDRFLKFLACWAIAMGCIAHAAAQAAPAEQDGGPVRPAGPVSDAANSANLLHSALGSAPPQVVSPAREDPAPFVSDPVAAGGPGKTAEPNAPTPDPSEESGDLDLSSFDAASSLPLQKMPVYSVLGFHVPEYRERDIYTKSGMVAAAFKRHPGLVVGNQFRLNVDAAQEMFLEDDWRDTMGDYHDMAHAMALGGDRLEGRMIMEEIIAEDMEVRAEAESQADQPSNGQFRLGQIGSNSQLLEVPAIPFDITVVQMKW
jgi:hypothetical protein